MGNEKRLIDLEKARLSVLEILQGKVTTAVAVKVACAMNREIVDAVEVVHARWILEQDYMDGTADYKCSNCEYDDNFFTKTLEIYIKYCPCCGAKMDGGNEDG